ncbi:MAG: CotH kinase family protein [Lachnospiraceae bacterium]|nr:CotH kinase family protein [Lachnospiraceae bacterium]
MNSLRRSTILIIFSIVLAVFSIPCLYYIEMRFSYTLLDIYLQDHAIPEDISFSSGNATEIKLNPSTDPVYYIACMPAEVSFNQKLDVSFSHFRTLEINGQTFHSGDEIYAFAKSIANEPVTLRIFAPRGENLYDGYIEFMFTDSLPTMYLTTSENAIDSVNATPDDVTEKPRISSTLKILDTDGSVDTITDAKIYRHGNTSFDYFNQKPYNLSLPSKCGLLGMTPGRKWVLKSNGQYSTVVLKNEIAFETARHMGDLVSPESRYINLYVNGRYFGLYQLSRRAEDADIIPDHNIKALIELDVKYERRPYHFVYNDMGLTVHYPEKLSEEEFEDIKNTFINAIDAVDQDGDYEIYIDMDSFIKMYTLQDFYVQTDIDGDSLYFYIGEDDKIYVGPVWDFDCAMGHITSGPYHDELTIRSRYFNNFGKLFFRSLERSERFRKAAAEYYRLRFSDLIDGYVTDKLKSDVEMIRTSISISDKANDMYPTDKRTDDDPDAVVDWICSRKKYLDDYYDNTDSYDPVTFYFAWGSMTTAAKKNVPLGFLPDNDHPYNTDDIWGEINGFEDVSGNIASDDTVISGPLNLYSIYAEDSPTAMYGYFIRPSEAASKE